MSICFSFIPGDSISILLFPRSWVWTELVFTECITILYIIVYPVTLDDIGTIKMMAGYGIDNIELKTMGFMQKIMLYT